MCVCVFCICFFQNLSLKKKEKRKKFLGETFPGIRETSTEQLFMHRLGDAAKVFLPFLFKRVFSLKLVHCCTVLYCTFFRVFAPTFGKPTCCVEPCGRISQC